MVVHTRDHQAPSSGCFSFIQSLYNDPMISINRTFIPCILKISQNQTIVFKTKHNFIQRLWFYLKSTLHWEIYRKAKVMFVFCKGRFHRPVCVQCSLTPAPPPSQFQLAERPVKDGEQGDRGASALQASPAEPRALSASLYSSCALINKVVSLPCFNTHTHTQCKDCWWAAAFCLLHLLLINIKWGDKAIKLKPQPETVPTGSRTLKSSINYRQYKKINTSTVMSPFFLNINISTRSDHTWMKLFCIRLFINMFISWGSMGPDSLLAPLVDVSRNATFGASLLA